MQPHIGLCRGDLPRLVWRAETRLRNKLDLRILTGLDPKQSAAQDFCLLYTSAVEGPPGA